MSLLSPRQSGLRMDCAYRKAKIYYVSVNGSLLVSVNNIGWDLCCLLCFIRAERDAHETTSMYVFGTIKFALICNSYNLFLRAFIQYPFSRRFQSLLP